MPKQLATDSNFVILENEQIVGICSISCGRDSDSKDWGEIVAIYLLPEYFGKGFGSLLFKAAIAQLKQRGFSNIYLWVLSDNMRARKFYEKNGFICSGIERNIEIQGFHIKEVKYINYKSSLLKYYLYCNLSKGCIYNYITCKADLEHKSKYRF